MITSSDIFSPLKFYNFHRFLKFIPCEKKLELFGDLTIGVMGFLRPGQAIISDCGAKAKVAFIEKYKLGKVVGKRKINYGSYYVVEFNLARLAQLDPEGTERYGLSIYPVGSVQA